MAHAAGMAASTCLQASSPGKVAATADGKTSSAGGLRGAGSVSTSSGLSVVLLGRSLSMILECCLFVAAITGTADFDFIIIKLASGLG